jgi:hypothetical protein
MRWRMARLLPFFDSLIARHLSYSVRLGLQIPKNAVEVIWLRRQIALFEFFIVVHAWQLPAAQPFTLRQMVASVMVFGAKRSCVIIVANIQTSSCMRICSYIRCRAV